MLMVSLLAVTTLLAADARAWVVVRRPIYARPVVVAPVYRAPVAYVPPPVVPRYGYGYAPPYAYAPPYYGGAYVAGFRPAVVWR